jgi:hypothetical protein
MGNLIRARLPDPFRPARHWSPPFRGLLRLHASLLVPGEHLP